MKNILRLSLISLAAVILLSACRADGTSDTNTSNANTPLSAVAQAIFTAEANGTIPTLNHDDTIAGPDTDGNGIRDDIDAYIATLPYTEVQKKAVQQEARAISASLTVNISDKNALMAVADAMSRASSCEFSRFDINTAGSTDIEKMTVNTKNRFMAYEKYNSSLSGEVFSDSSLNGAVCDN